MSDHCKYKNSCTNPEEEGCLLGMRNYRECPYLKEKKEKDISSSNDATGEFELQVIWTGNSLGEIDLKTLSYKKRPIIIGLIGPSNAGKTTLLATLYLLLRSGKKINGFSFAGSNTLIGWENIAYFLTCRADNLIEFPPHTSRNAGRIPGMLHLKLIDHHAIYHDVLFTDAPGEWFTTWANKADDNNAAGARWINENSDAFLLFADCDAFVKDIGNARLELKSIAERFRNTNNNRAVALTWSKSDIEVDREIKEGIGESICSLFSIKKEFHVSVKGDNREQFHENLLNLFDWIFGNIFQTTNAPINIEVKNFDDFFFVKR